RSGCFTSPATHDLAEAARRLNFAPGRSAARVGADDQLFLQLAVTEDLDAVRAPIRQAEGAQCPLIHARAVLEPVQRFNAHRDVAGGKARVVEAALGNPENQRHLTAFKNDEDGAAGDGG